MKIREAAVTNAANPSFFMVNFSYALLSLLQKLKATENAEKKKDKNAKSTKKSP